MKDRMNERVIDKMIEQQTDRRVMLQLIQLYQFNKNLLEMKT